MEPIFSSTVLAKSPFKYKRKKRHYYVNGGNAFDKVLSLRFMPALPGARVKNTKSKPRGSSQDRSMTRILSVNVQRDYIGL
ncbi:hypothetical protein DNTS_024556 [Danionella cerebrum]|uniref:Uncharacterized protein n=1 Tax=Danionella cerebrum TaxID=2873325 RepID=A0A553QTN4_9TELE|nr:hypothetical protein DNTS_024556 [Danionella translucida]